MEQFLYPIIFKHKSFHLYKDIGHISEGELLSRTYVVRTLYRPDKGRVAHPDYTFLSIHYEQVQDYLALLDWDLRKDDSGNRIWGMHRN